MQPECDTAYDLVCLGQDALGHQSPLLARFRLRPPERHRSPSRFAFAEDSFLAALGPDHRDEACAAFTAVARAWAEGEPRFAARADSARRRLTALRCESSR